MPDRPDLVLILTDQQRSDQVGFESSGFFETPHLDRLAKQGVVLDQAYSGSTTCIPARNALLTGLQHVHVPTHDNGLNLQEGFWTVAHALRRAGYQTAYVGKMHAMPMYADHGFDIVRLCEDIGFSRQSAGWGPHDLDDYHTWLVGQGVVDWRDVPPDEWFRRIGRWFPLDAELHPTAWIAHEARTVFANRDPLRPLLLVASFPQPHPPASPPDAYLSRYVEADSESPADGFEVNLALPEPFVAALRTGQQRPGPSGGETGQRAVRNLLTRVRALVAQIDDSVGRILECVDMTRSVVFFTSDHGDYAGHRGLLRKRPWIPFDDLARVALVVAGFDVVGERHVSSLAQSCDFALTCLDYAGEKRPSDEFDTRSLRPLLRRATTDSGDEDRAVMCSATGWPMIRQGAMKYILHRQSGSAVLFDLALDPGETQNVLDDRAYKAVGDDLAQELQLRLARRGPELERFPPRPNRISTKTTRR